VSKSQIQAGAAKRTEPEPAASAISEEEPKPEAEPEPERPIARNKKAKAAPPPEPENEPEPEARPDIVSSSAPPPASAKNGWMSTGSYVLLGTSLAGVAGYGVLTYWGRKDNDKLAVCSPDCAQSDVDHIDRLYLGANLSLGVGVAALLGGAYVMWRNHHSYSLERVAVEPTRSGALATFSGSF